MRDGAPGQPGSPPRRPEAHADGRSSPMLGSGRNEDAQQNPYPPRRHGERRPGADRLRYQQFEQRGHGEQLRFLARPGRWRRQRQGRRHPAGDRQLGPLGSLRQADAAGRAVGAGLRGRRSERPGRRPEVRHPGRRLHQLRCQGPDHRPGRPGRRCRGRGQGEDRGHPGHQLRPPEPRRLSTRSSSDRIFPPGVCVRPAHSP